MKGYMYILECCDSSYYTGSTINMDRRLNEHQTGLLPVKVVYMEEYPRIDLAFKREKQVQGWSRQKKEALINGQFDKLKELSKPKQSKKDE